MTTAPHVQAGGIDGNAAQPLVVLGLSVPLEIHVVPKTPPMCLADLGGIIAVELPYKTCCRPAQDLARIRHLHGWHLGYRERLSYGCLHHNCRRLPKPHRTQRLYQLEEAPCNPRR